MAGGTPWDLLGLTVSGDLGGWTIYTDRFNRKIVFPKSPPEKPPTPDQLHQRDRFRQAQAQWAALTTHEKSQLEELCRQAYVPMTGQNLWLHCALRNDNAALATLQRQTGITTPFPNFIP